MQGVILAFYTPANLDAGANRAAELAQGIYAALITAFAGLCVAIPAAMIAHYLEGRIYVTALHLLTLEMPARHRPTSSTRAK